jgi:ABC-type amino acid transport substrate-binding protein
MVASGLPPAMAAAPAPLRIIMSSSSPLAWISSRILAAVYARVGMSFRATPIPLMRAAMEIVAGNADGELARVATYFKDKPYLLRVEPAFVSDDALAYSLSRRSLQLRGSEDLLRYSVGYQRGQAFARDLTERHQQVTLAQATPQLLRMLQAERVDVVLLHRMNGQYFVDKMGLRGIVEASASLGRDDFYHALSEHHRALVEPLAGTIRSMKASGELARLTMQAVTELGSVELPAFSES